MISGERVQMLWCETGGQPFAVMAEEIEAVERDRQNMLHRILVTRGRGSRIPVDRVGGVREIPGGEVLPLPDSMPESCGLHGVVDWEGRKVALVSSDFLQRGCTIQALPERTIPRFPSLSAEPVSEPHLMTFALGKMLDGTQVVAALPVEQILEVCEALEWVPLDVPGGRMMGLVPWRGVTAPLVDLAHVFDLRPEPERSKRLVIARGTMRSQPVALWAPEVLQRVSPTRTRAASMVEPLLAGAPLRGVFHWLNRLMLIPDLDQLN